MACQLLVGFITGTMVGMLALFETKVGHWDVHHPDYEAWLNGEPTRTVVYNAPTRSTVREQATPSITATPITRMHIFSLLVLVSSIVLATTAAWIYYITRASGRYRSKSHVVSNQPSITSPSGIPGRAKADEKFIQLLEASVQMLHKKLNWSRKETLTYKLLLSALRNKQQGTDQEIRTYRNLLAERQEAPCPEPFYFVDDDSDHEYVNGNGDDSVDSQHGRSLKSQMLFIHILTGDSWPTGSDNASRGVPWGLGFESRGRCPGHQPR